MLLVLPVLRGGTSYRYCLCDWDLNSLMWTLASHWHGHYGCVCVRVGAMPIERKTHPRNQSVRSIELTGTPN